VESPKPQASQADSTDLPEWARKQISDANSEAANFRVQLKEEKRAAKELRDQLVALSAQQTEVASSQASVQSDFDKLVTAIKAEVPHEHIFSFAKTLQGGSEDELSAHAAELKSMFSSPPSRAVDRSQGQGSGPTPLDPAAEFAKILQAQLSR
jgi:chromosome segregation ATPase